MNLPIADLNSQIEIMDIPHEPPPPQKKPPSSLRRALWRGTSIIAPPLVTLLLLIWIASAVEQYVLLPLESAGRWG